MKKFFLFFLILFILLVFIFLALFIFYFGNKQNVTSNPAPSPTQASFPTPFVIQKSNNAAPAVPFSQEDKKNAQISFLVSSLINKLPHYGNRFSFYYSFAKDEFILYLSPSFSLEANKEFDLFLKENGVEDRSWIKNLVIVKSTITPAP